MPAETTPALDPHQRIDTRNPAQVQEVADKLDTTPEEISAAVGKVGDHPVAVALYLERPDAV
jgi:hypothetical protein